jgi:hypothetical protein
MRAAAFEENGFRRGVRLMHLRAFGGCLWVSAMGSLARVAWSARAFFNAGRPLCFSGWTPYRGGVAGRQVCPPLSVVDLRGPGLAPRRPGFLRGGA